MKHNQLSTQEGNFKAYEIYSNTMRPGDFWRLEYQLEINGILMLAQVYNFGKVWRLRVTDGAWPYVPGMGGEKPVIELESTSLRALAAKLNEDVPWEKWLASIITRDANGV